jgi:predicted enzyme related to lactoylglutathione lyase
MPGPRRTPPAENTDLMAAYPYPTHPQRPGTPRIPDPPAAPTATAGRPGDLDGDEQDINPSSAPAEARQPGPEAARRTDLVGVARVPQPRPLLPGLQLQPMVHVDDMASAVAFYERLGGEINHGDRSGDWVLMQVGTAQIGLVTRPPNASRGESTVELNFTATMPLDQLEQILRAQGVIVVEMTADRDLGMQLHVETPEGMPIKIHQVEPELMV